MATSPIKSTPKLPPARPPAPAAKAKPAPAAPKPSAPAAPKAPAALNLAAPSGTGATLSKGAQGAQVKDLQSKLNARGFASGPVDGDFGPKTDGAVRRFQSANGLQVDGIVGPKTWAKLNTSAAPAPAAPAPAPAAPAPAAGAHPTLKIGSKGAAVSDLQTRLNGAGFNSGPVDGNFGRMTDAAVRSYQSSRGLTVDGVAGPQTWKSLTTGAPATQRPPPPAASGDYAYPLAQRGMLNGRPNQGTHTRGNWQSDNAIDINIPRGTPVYAVADGKIGSRIGPLNSSEPALAGQRLTLETGDNAFYYAHLSTLSIQAGQSVKKGDLLGYSGSANGVPHLHIGAQHGNPVQMFGH